MNMGWVCGFAVGVLLVTVVGHLIWLIAASIFNGIFGTNAGEPRPPRPFRYCPGCGADTDERELECRRCGLMLDGRRARDVHRVRTAEREIRALIDAAQIDRDNAEPILEQLENRARAIQGLPVAKRARPRAKAVVPEPLPAPEPLAPPDAVELVTAGEGEGEPARPAGLPGSLPESHPTPKDEANESPLLSPATAAVLADVIDRRRVDRLRHDDDADDEAEERRQQYRDAGAGGEHPVDTRHRAEVAVGHDVDFGHASAQPGRRGRRPRPGTPICHGAA